MVHGSPDGRIWLAFRDPDSPEDYLLAGLNRPERRVQLASESGDAASPDRMGKTIITPAMLLR